METQVGTMQNEMNWVDYCDSLGDEYFKRITQSKARYRPDEKSPNPVSIAVERQEAAREFA